MENLLKSTEGHELSLPSRDGELYGSTSDEDEPEETEEPCLENTTGIMHLPIEVRFHDEWVLL